MYLLRKQPSAAAGFQRRKWGELDPIFFLIFMLDFELAFLCSSFFTCEIKVAFTAGSHKVCSEGFVRMFSLLLFPQTPLLFAALLGAQ